MVFTKSGPSPWLRSHDSTYGPTVIQTQRRVFFNVFFFFVKCKNTLNFTNSHVKHLAMNKILWSKIYSKWKIITSVAIRSRTFWKSNFDTISLFIMIVNFCSICVHLYRGFLTRKLNHINIYSSQNKNYTIFLIHFCSHSPPKTATSRIAGRHSIFHYFTNAILIFNIFNNNLNHFGAR